MRGGRSDGAARFPKARGLLLGAAAAEGLFLLVDGDPAEAEEERGDDDEDCRNGVHAARNLRWRCVQGARWKGALCTTFAAPRLARIRPERDPPTLRRALRPCVSLRRRAPNAYASR